MISLDRVVRGLHVAGALLLVAGVLVTAVVTFPPLVGADHTYVVISGSMEPAIEPGDVVFVSNTEPEQVESGDVIAFDRVAGDDRRTTHRVVEVVERDGERHFRTKGDANENPDQQLVPPGAVVGTVGLTIPYVGWVFSFATSDTGVIALVIVPGVLLVGSEVWTLVTAARSDATEQSAEGNSGESES